MNALLSPTARAFAGALLCSFASLISLRGQPVEVSGDTLRLPDYKVVDTPNLAPVERWRYTQIAGFEVLSNGSDNTTRKLLADFARFTKALQLIWPGSTKKFAASTLILCGREAKFDAFVPADTDTQKGLTNSLFLSNREQISIVADVEADRVTVGQTEALNTDVAGSVEYEVNHYRLLYREYLRYLLNQAELRPPVWVEEGLAQIVMDIEMTHTSLIYGRINSLQGLASGTTSIEDETNPNAPTDVVVGEKTFNAALINKKLMPLGQFFAITAESPEAQNRLGNNLWSKQAYAFVHFCLFGEKLQYKDAFALFVQRLAREPLSEQLFKECFKVSYSDMQKQLGGYIRHTRHKYQKYPLEKGDKLDPDSIELRDATPAEIAVIKGDALRLAGRHEPAFVAYRSAYLRRDRSPALLAGLGLVEKELRHPDRSRDLLEAAVQTNAPRPSAYVEVARLRFAEAEAKPAAGDGKFSNAQVASVLKPLFAARQHEPRLPETYAFIAAAWAKSATPPKPENLAVLDEGIRAFPRDSDLLYQSAQLYRTAGADQIASSIARLGLRFATEAAAKDRFEQLLAALPPPPPPAKS